jgi:glutathione S-transferase
MTETILWGVELSPFVLKIQACLYFSGRPFRRLPDQGNYLENTQTLLALEIAKSRKKITRYPSFNKELDEYPAVPFLSEDGIHFQYDSSAIALWLDTQNSSLHAPLYPEEPAIQFIARLIDEAFDEFGLYMVHHMRWIGSAKSNQMGVLLAKEFRHALPPGGSWYLAKSFPKRQVRRCPYLFSIAPDSYKPGMPKSLTPPARKGFPETHTLLHQCWENHLEGMETVLAKQAYLLGDRFTIADASAYGQLAMNLVDPEAAEKMQRIAPLTFAWLKRIYRNEHGTGLQHNQDNTLYLNPALKPLLNTIMSTFSALMVQNSRAFDMAKQQGETLFNEKAFDQNRALYDGRLCGFPFRSVVKTFQVRVWKELCNAWQALEEKDKNSVRELIDVCELFET